MSIDAFGGLGDSPHGSFSLANSPHRRTPQSQRPRCSLVPPCSCISALRFANRDRPALYVKLPNRPYSNHMGSSHCWAVLRSVAARGSEECIDDLSMHIVRGVGRMPIEKAVLVSSHLQLSAYHHGQMDSLADPCIFCSITFTCRHVSSIQPSFWKAVFTEQRKMPTPLSTSLCTVKRPSRDGAKCWGFDVVADVSISSTLISPSLRESVLL